MTFMVVMLYATAPAAWGDDDTPTVDQVVAKTNHASYYQGADGRAQVDMTITDKAGRTRERRFTILRWDAPANDQDQGQKFYVYFHRPADLNKMVFMVHKHLDRDDDRWLYLPDLDLVKRIAASDKRTSFVGSDFYYEDVSGRRIDDDQHELVKTTDTYYVIKNTPKDKAMVEFDHYIMWVHRETFLPIKVEYFDAAGDKYREYQALRFEKIGDYPTITQAQMKDLRTGSTTVLSYSDVAYDLKLPEDIFNERYLRKAPREHLR